MNSGSVTLLDLNQISKAWPGVQALAQVDFDLAAGEVHALVGENGAGKSTLSKIICGLESPDGGAMKMEGAAYCPAGKRDAEARGVVMVMQEPNLIPTLTVAENIFLDMLPNRLGFVNFRETRDKARKVLAAAGIPHIDPSILVSQLSVSEQQMVMIAAALARTCRVLILDEPTASLTDREAELLFAQMTRLKAGGTGIIYISHRMEEIVRVADRVTVLRDGSKIATERAESLTTDRIVRLMVGRDAVLEDRGKPRSPGPVALRIEGLQNGERVCKVSFEARQGEILGFAGLIGSGRTETMRAIYGADRRQAGEIFFKDSTQPTAVSSPSDAVRQGMALLPEDRRGQGLLLPQSVRFNISLVMLDALARFGFIDRGEEQQRSLELSSRLNIKSAGIEQPVAELSGGNQQKVMLGRCLARGPEILIFDEPTRGIDIGARQEIYSLMRDLAGQGKTLLVVSSDLEELIVLCDRIAVMSKGRLKRIFERGQWTRDAIMAAALSEHLSTARGGSEAA